MRTTLLAFLFGAASVAALTQLGGGRPAEAKPKPEPAVAPATSGRYAESFNVTCADGVATEISTGAMRSVYCQNMSSDEVIVGDSTHVADSTGVSFCTDTATCPRADWGNEVWSEYCSGNGTAVAIKCWAQVERPAAP